MSVSTVLSTLHALRRLTGPAPGLSHPVVHTPCSPSGAVGLSLGEASDRLAALHAVQGVLPFQAACCVHGMWPVAWRKADGRMALSVVADERTLSVVADERTSCAFSLDWP